MLFGTKISRVMENKNDTIDLRKVLKRIFDKKLLFVKTLGVAFV